MLIRCPNCQSALEIDAGSAGPDVECTACRRKFTLSGEETRITKNKAVEETVISSAAAETKQAGSNSQRKQFGDYEIIREIARGGMGVVFQARHQKLNRLVALKMIRAGELAGKEEITRFYTEARAAAKLDHPGIVAVHDVGQQNGQHYIALAYVDGQSLKDKIAQRPLPPKNAAKLMHAVAEAVQFAHEHGVIHRDLKPHNILVDKSGQPRVTDFGLAKDTRDDVEMTATGQLIGTPAYMSPEQAAGKKTLIDERSDVYSLGATLYCLLTGRPPFQAATHVETIRQVIDDDPVSPRLLNPEVPKDLESVCLKCLRKEPRARYASAAELAQDLQRFLNQQPVLARPVTRWERWRRWILKHPTAAALILVLIAGAGTSLFLLGKWIDTVEFASGETGRANISEQEKEEAVLRQRESDIATANEQLDNGLEACQEGEIDLGVHWMIRALETAPEDAEKLQQSIRRNISLWSPRLNVLLRQYDMPEFGTRPITNADKSIAVRVASRSWDGSTAVAIVHRWNAQTGELLNGSPTEIESSLFNSERRNRIVDAMPIWLSQDGHVVVVTELGSKSTGELPNGRAPRLERWDLDTQEVHTLSSTTDRYWEQVSISPDGAWLGSVESTLESIPYNERTYEIRVRELATGRLVFESNGYRAPPIAPVFTANGERFVIQSQEDRQTAELRQTTDGQRIGNPFSIGASLKSVCFNQDGTVLAATDGTEKVSLWNGADGTRFRHTNTGWGSENNLLEGRNTDQIDQIVIDPDGRTLVAMSTRDETIRIWNLETGTQIGQTVHRQPTECVFLNSGKDLLFFSEPIEVWRLANTDTSSSVEVPADSTPEDLRRWAEESTGTELTEAGTLHRISRGESWKPGDPVGPATPTVTPDVPPQSARLVSNESYDGSMLIRMVPVRMQGESVFITQVAFGSRELPFSPDGERLILLGQHEVHLVDGWTEAPICDSLPVAPQHYVHDFAFSSDSKLMLVGTGNDLTTGEVTLWNLEDGTLAGGPFPQESAATAVEFSPTGESFVVGYGFMIPDPATGRCIGHLQFWDTANRVPIGPPLEHEGRVTSALFTPDGRKLFTASTLGRNARLWNVDTLQPIGEPMPHGAGVLVAAMSPDGSIVATGSFDNLVRLWSTETAMMIGEPLPLPHTLAIHELAFSRDGRRLASASNDLVACLWDVESRQLLREPSEYGLINGCVEFSEDGRILVMGGPGSVPRFVNSETGALLKLPIDLTNARDYVGFRPDGALLVGIGGVIRVFDDIDWDAVLEASESPAAP